MGEKFLGVETYLFDCEEDLYGEPCRVEFFHYSRPEKRFSSIEALKEQLMKDAEKGKAYFQSFETGQEPCAILFEVKKASIQKPETPTTS